MSIKDWKVTYICDCGPVGKCHNVCTFCGGDGFWSDVYNGWVCDCVVSMVQEAAARVACTRCTVYEADAHFPELTYFRPLVSLCRSCLEITRKEMKVAWKEVQKKYAEKKYAERKRLELGSGRREDGE